MNYRQAVSKARQLVKRSEADQWELARLTHEQVVEDGVSQTKWAKDIGVSPSHVATLSKVWEFYSHVRMTKTRRTFGEYYVLARRSEEEAGLLEKEADSKGLMVTTVDRTGTKARVHQVQEALRDPKIRREAFRDPDVVKELAQDTKTRAAFVKASRDVDEEAEDRATARERRRTPQLRNRGVQYEIIGQLTSVRYSLNRVLDRMRDLELDDEVVDSILEVLTEVENSTEWIRSFLESGDRSFDKALDRLLSEGR